MFLDSSPINHHYCWWTMLENAWLQFKFVFNMISMISRPSGNISMCLREFFYQFSMHFCTGNRIPSHIYHLALCKSRTALVTLTFINQLMAETGFELTISVAIAGVVTECAFVIRKFTNTWKDNNILPPIQTFVSELRRDVTRWKPTQNNRGVTCTCKYIGINLEPGRYTASMFKW